MTSHIPDVPEGYPFQRDLEITPREAAALLRDRPDQTLVIDCREPAEWETSRVAGMVLIPLGEIQARIDEIEAFGRAEVAVMCHHGRRSMKAALLLRQLGIENAMSVAGGIEWWSRSVDPAVPRYVKDASGCRVVG
jgi:rhodanese-related sulfurtransferase